MPQGAPVHFFAPGYCLYSQAKKTSAYIVIFRKLAMFERFQHPHNQKLCAKRSISTQKLLTKKNIFLQKMFFRNIFHFFRHLKIQNIAILPFRDTSIEKT